jgi:hypothetical protein
MVACRQTIGNSRSAMVLSTMSMEMFRGSLDFIYLNHNIYVISHENVIQNNTARVRMPTSELNDSYTK